MSRDHRRELEEASAKIRRDALERKLGKVEGYLGDLARAWRLSDYEEVVRLMNFAGHIHDLMARCMEMMDTGDA